LSKSSYGSIAYRIPHAAGATDQQIIEEAQFIVSEMVSVLTRYGGSLTTLREVYQKQMSGNERIGEQSTADAVRKKKPK
jgi:hypothetical protein